MANLAGIPESVIRRARQALKEAESGGAAARPAPRETESEDQISFMDLSAERVTEKLRKCQPDAMTPLEALNFLYELKREVAQR